MRLQFSPLLLLPFALAPGFVGDPAGWDPDFASAEAHPVAPPSIASTPAELGRLLFWDPLLSGPMDVACGSCHHPDHGYADGRALSLGTGSVGLGPDRRDLSGGAIPVVGRNSPTVLNAALNGLEDRRGRRGRDEFGVIAEAMVRNNPERAPMFWDNRVRGLEGQALEPLRAREEMRGDAYGAEVAVDSVLARLNAVPEYVALFANAFGREGEIVEAELAGALAAFQRTLVAVDTPFDRYQAGDLTALSEVERRGLEAFDDVGCTQCHGGPMFSDFDLHAEGVAENPLLQAPDEGGGRFRFRTPSLRNVALTAPYMHNGMLPTLEEVLRFYDRGVSENPNVANRNQGRGEAAEGSAPPRPAVLDGDFRRVDNMSEREMSDIVAFLGALTDPAFDRTIPARVPSGLPVGGAIH